jgi:hypothetical protein
VSGVGISGVHASGFLPESLLWCTPEMGLVHHLYTFCLQFQKGGLSALSRVFQYFTDQRLDCGIYQI